VSECGPGTSTKRRHWDSRVFEPRGGRRGTGIFLALVRNFNIFDQALNRVSFERGVSSGLLIGLAFG